MKTVLAELYRASSVTREGILQEDARYLLALGDKPVRFVEPRLSYDAYRKLLRKLDYGSSTEEERQEAIDDMTEVVTRVLRSDRFDWEAVSGEGDAEPVQLDLVLNPAELSGLPFEVARGPDAECLFRRQSPVIVTRRIRGGFRVRRPEWPHEPRILFASASPPKAGKPVPFQEHLDALLEALQPWIEPLEGAPGAGDYRRVLTVVREANLTEIKAACAAAVERGAPFTHVHVLAHGCPIQAEDDFVNRRFGLALHPDPETSGDLQAVSPEQLAKAVSPVGESCMVVTLAICYGGSQANPLIPEGGIAHTLHGGGIPIVVASQWPLTYEGSEEVTRRFYTRLLPGDDVRVVLHETRQALRARRDECLEDWASLVGYVSLPEGYADYLFDVGLKTSLAALETASRWADDLVLAEDSGAEAFGRSAERVDARFRERVADLKAKLGRARDRGRSDVLGENLGLLGSAHKRIAELYHRWSRAAGPDPEREERMWKALQEARGWYRQGAERNIGEHWLATQSLSLEAVLTGRIADPAWWQIAAKAAELATRGDQPHWAWGSLAELHLLGQAGGGALPLGPAKKALKAFLAGDPGAHAVLSTRRQLHRYRDWWTNSNGFFPGAKDLSTSATELVDVLNGAEE